MVFNLHLVNDLDLHSVENIIITYRIHIQKLHQLFDHITAFVLFSKDKNLKIRNM